MSTGLPQRGQPSGKKNPQLPRPYQPPTPPFVSRGPFILRIILVVGIIAIVVGWFLSRIVSTDTSIQSTLVISLPTSPVTSITPTPLLADLIEQVQYAVVQIFVPNTNSQGSGVVIDPSGLVLTNAHVVERGTEIEVGLYQDGRTLNTQRGTLVAIAACDDLALISLPSGRYPALPLSMVPQRAGNEVIALGYPLNGSIASNSPSATHDTVSRVSISLNHLHNLIEHQASINPGSSGGPLLNRVGEVIGLNTFRLPDTQGLFYAIHVDRIREVIGQISRGDYHTHFDTLTVTTPFEGGLRSNSERSCLRFTPGAGQSVILEARGKQNEDMELMVFSPDFQFVGYNDDIGGSNVTARLRIQDTTAGDYLVVVFSSNLKTPIDFTLMATPDN